MLQLGNCGSPIETDAGWLVLTHGVGPMRTYSIGALLLDLDDPTRCSASSASRCSRPAADEQDGYVPNVVYSCGALVHAGILVLPYGISDAAIGFATVPVSELLAALDPRRSAEPVRVAVLAPIAWRTPPRHYGPWELFASLLTEGLVARGHDVTLFATGDSRTSARLRSVVATGWSEDPTIDPRWRSACTSRRCSSAATSSTSSTTASTSSRSPTPAW